MKKIGYYLAVIFLFASSNAFAICSTRTCIDKIESIGTNRLVDFHWISLKNTQQSAVTGCTFDSGIYAKLPMTSPRSKELFAVLLLAQSLNSEVIVDYLQGSNPCEIVSVLIRK